MRKIVLLLAALLLPALAHAQVVKTSSGGQVVTTGGKPLTVGGSYASYVGPVATGAGPLNTTISAANTSCMTRKMHIMRSTTSRLKFGYTNWIVDLSANKSGTEQGPGNSISVSGWVEYPVGTYAQMLFSGSATGTIANATTAYSDFLSTSIPNGATFYTWTYVTPPASGFIPYKVNTDVAYNPLWVAGGEKANCATSGVPTSPGALTDNHNGAYAFYPTAILGDTTAPTYCLVGDSRTAGIDNYADGTTDLGDLARSIGPSRGYINMGLAGDKMQLYIFSSALRRELITASNCTHIIDEVGVNDRSNASLPEAYWQSTKQTMTALFNGKRYIRTTMEPFSTSTDSWKTTAGQTVASWWSKAATANAWLRTEADGVQHADIGTPVSTSLDSGKWLTNGYAQTYVRGGIHATSEGDKLIAKAKAIDPDVIETYVPISVSYPSIDVTNIASPSYVAGVFGNALALTAGGTARGLVSSGFVPTSPNMTVECRVNLYAYGGNLLVGGEVFKTDASTHYIGIDDGGGATHWSTTVIPLEEWHHLALVITPGGASNSTETLYYDGVNILSWTRSIGGLYSYYGLAFANNYSGTGPSKARFDECAIWNYPKYTTDFTPPASAYTGNESGLIGLWHFDSNLTGIRGPAGL